ncbi:MAG: hypothetical protein PHP31_05065 [Lentimicrobiaceae bacterium]|nr:hypothetical protein [Lentimicrobiaceae bacterium]
MKTIKTLKTVMLIAVLTLGVQFYALAQSPLPPEPPIPSGPTVGDEGSAPIGSGLVVLLTLAGAYGGYKLYKNSNEDEEQES